MTYIRLTLVRPLHNQEEHAKELLTRLAAIVSQQDGCLESYVLKPHDSSGELARISIYRDEQAAAQLATSNNEVMALHSQLDLVIDPTSHTERAFFSVD